MLWMWRLESQNWFGAESENQWYLRFFSTKSEVLNVMNVWTKVSAFQNITIYNKYTIARLQTAVKE